MVNVHPSQFLHELDALIPLDYYPANNLPSRLLQVFAHNHSQKCDGKNIGIVQIAEKNPLLCCRWLTCNGSATKMTLGLRSLKMISLKYLQTS